MIARFQCPATTATTGSTICGLTSNFVARTVTGDVAEPTYDSDGKASGLLAGTDDSQFSPPADEGTDTDDDEDGKHLTCRNDGHVSSNRGTDPS